MEAFMFGGHRLHVYLSILFNIFLKYGYVPNEFCRSVIIPLVKNKTADLTDANNYRAIALSNAVTKILENLLFSFIECGDDVDDYQFGFRKRHSTAACTRVFKDTVNYYRQHGSHVFSCFIDFTKAFDNVDYWLLFSKLLDFSKSVACNLAVRLLGFWYSQQQMCIRWQNIESDYFGIANGVRQGGILSPYLFRVYIRDLIRAVVMSNIGCTGYNGFCLNLLAYADDIVILAPSWQGLQLLLKIIDMAARAIELSFNTKKTVCMVFNPCDKHKMVCNSFPQFQLAGCYLSFVSQFRYLGHIIENTFSDDSDIHREIKCLFTRTNLLIRRFSRCSMQVKVKLFKSFCICFYNIGLWENFHVYCLNKFASAYVKCIKIFFGFHKYSSVTNMLLQLGLPSFNTVLHNARIRFANNLHLLDNSVVSVSCRL